MGKKSSITRVSCNTESTERYKGSNLKAALLCKQHCKDWIAPSYQGSQICIQPRDSCSESALLQTWRTAVLHQRDTPANDAKETQASSEESRESGQTKPVLGGTEPFLISTFLEAKGEISAVLNTSSYQKRW